MSALGAIGGAITGMMVGDSLGAIPQRAAVPATSNAAKAKVTGDGKPVSPTATPRQSIWISVGIVIGALALLLGGARFLRDARIG